MSQFALKPLALHIVSFTGLWAGSQLALAESIKPWLALSPSAVSAVHTSQVKQINIAPEQQYRFHADHVLGTSLDVILTAANVQQAEMAFANIQQTINQLDAVLSIWREDSEISQLNRAAHMHVSPELFEVIAACEAWRCQTNGAFSARLGKIITQQQDLAYVLQLAQAIDAAEVLLDASTFHISRPDDVLFAPDAYAKGYIIDRVLAQLQQVHPDITGVMLDIGGDVRVWRQQQTQKNSAGWRIGVQQANITADNVLPDQVLNLHNCAIAYSGRGYRDCDGSSHLLDPQTGVPLNEISQSVVVAPTAADADALATALAAMDAEHGMQLIGSLAQVEAQWMTRDGQMHQSAGWQYLLATPEDTQAMRSMTIADSGSSSWPAGFNVTLDYEVPKIDAAQYRAPYVVIWVTDENKQLVRTLSVLGKDEKWFDSNYIWWKRYGRKMSNLDTVAKPSRKPGKYTAVWDGKDDDGKLVSAGSYTIHVESAREHGDHSYQSFKLDVAPKPSKQDIAPEGELGKLSLVFGRAL